MPSFQCVRESTIVRTARVVQCESMFDVPVNTTSRVEWDVDLPIEDKPWNVGLIVGPSGCGKTTAANELFSAELIDSFDWPQDKCLLDGFPDSMSTEDICGLLSSVGFNSAPSWLRPFHVLSNGEQFRVTMARALAEQPALAVVDEFTSVVDRTVAKMGSVAIAKTVRRRDQKFVAIACHHELGNYVVPAYAGMLLAEQGADVVKWHTNTDPILDLNRGQELWAWINHRKQLQEVHLRSADWDVLTNVDIVIDNFMPTTLDAWGICPQRLAQQYNVAWVSMRSELPGRSFDVVAQARATLSHTPWIPFWLGDTSGGLWVAFKALSMLGQTGHAVLGQSSCLAKLVEGELLIDRPMGGGNPYEVDRYEADHNGATVEFKGEVLREPVRDHQWKLDNLWHTDGRINI